MVQASPSNPVLYLRRAEGLISESREGKDVRSPASRLYLVLEPSFLARSRQAQIRERVAGAVVLKSARRVTRQRQSTLTETYQRQSSAPAGLNGGRVAANFH